MTTSSARNGKDQGARTEGAVTVYAVRHRHRRASFGRARGARQPWLAAAVLVVFGVHTIVWGVIVVTLRQRVVPSRMLGRVASAYGLIDAGGSAFGSLLGGAFARALGITAPFWLACVVMVLVTAAAWRPLRYASGR